MSNGIQLSVKLGLEKVTLMNDIFDFKDILPGVFCKLAHMSRAGLPLVSAAL